MHKIAIIDDVPDSRDFLYYLLRDDYDVSRYESGEEALNQIHLDVPNLIIMDIWLRGIDGIEALKHIREHDGLRGIPVIAVTANAMAGDREKYLAAGFDEYVSKPILDIRNFLTTLEQFLPAS